MWNYSIEEVSRQLQTDSRKGLQSSEAGTRLKKFGPNQLPEPKPISPLKIFFNQFSSFIVWVLIAAAIIAGFLGEWIDASAIGVIIILNAVLGFIQEYRAERSLAALRKLSSLTSKVVRGGALHVLPSNLIVPGDLILLEAGDRIPADGRVVYSAQLATQEASLTGESVPVPKDTETILAKELPIGDRRNMAFMGTVAVNGKGYVIVTGTGLQTELGRIASLLQVTEREPTPLQARLEQLGHRLVTICLGVVVIVFLLGLLKGKPVIEMLLTALSLAVAAIPEGLPAVVTIALAIGVQKMARRNALIRRLPSVETLGCASVICTDKTGTLTQNEMTVRSLWANEMFIDVGGAGYAPEGDFSRNGLLVSPRDIPELELALRIGVLCNSAGLEEADGAWRVVGDPTEGALLVAAGKAGLKKEALESENPFLGEIPFDSERKRMSILRKTPEGEVLFVKGAPDILLDLSETILVNGEEVPLTDEHKKKAAYSNSLFASLALRVLAVAYRKAEPGKTVDKSLEEKLTFAGLLAMIDPPRPEAKKAIEVCKRAGIRTVMITGDHKETAVAIARELDLMDEKSLALNGTELEHMSDEDLKRIVRDTAVYARVSAEHKIRIIRAWKALGEVAAMTGDGVNDAPAIKEADIGVAMGITGTDVTKEASDMVIADDNFASIVSAVEEGRGIYDNIVKFVNYLISSNIAELLVIFVGMLLGLTAPDGSAFIPLSAVQLLWLNLVTDGFPAVALGMDPLDPRAMDQPPRKSSEAILSLRFAIQLFLIAVALAAGTLLTCRFGLFRSVELGQTMAFTTLVVLELVRVQMVRSRYHIGFFSNPWLMAALVSSLLLQLIVIYVPPLQKVFGTAPLGWEEWGVILSAAFVVWWAGVFINRIFRTKRDRR